VIIAGMEVGLGCGGIVTVEAFAFHGEIVDVLVDEGGNIIADVDGETVVELEVVTGGVTALVVMETVAGFGEGGFWRTKFVFEFVGEAVVGTCTLLCPLSSCEIKIKVYFKFNFNKGNKS